MVKARKTNYVDFGIDCWSQVNGWDNVQAKINLMSDDDWGLVFYNPYFNEVFINAPLKKGKCYMLNQEVENMGVITTESIQIFRIWLGLIIRILLAISFLGLGIHFETFYKKKELCQKKKIRTTFQED